MGNYKNWDELREALEGKVTKALNTNVKEYVEDQIAERINIDVYDAYNPIEYKRDYSLYNMENFHHYVNGNFKWSRGGSKYYPDMYLSVGHNAVTQDFKDLTKLIILGQERAKQYGDGIALYNDVFIKQRKARYNVEGNPMNETPFYEPRNFIGNAKMMIQAHPSGVINAFKKGMS